RSRLLSALNETSALISAGAELHAAVVGSIEVQLIAAARAIRGVTIDGGVDPHLLQPRGNPLWIVIVHADANVIDRAWICQLVNAENPVPESEIDAAVAWSADDLEAEHLRIEIGGRRHVAHRERGVIQRAALRSLAERRRILRGGQSPCAAG